jgi:hypothetical protein
VFYRFLRDALPVPPFLRAPMVKETLMIIVLGDLILYVVPGVGAVLLGYRWLKGKTVVSGLRMDAVKAELEAARQAARLSQGREQEQRTIIGDALTVAKRVEHLDDTMTRVADFLESRVAWRAGEPPTLPGAPGREPVTAGEQEEGRWS